MRTLPYCSHPVCPECVSPCYVIRGVLGPSGATFIMQCSTCKTEFKIHKQKESK